MRESGADNGEVRRSRFPGSCGPMFTTGATRISEVEVFHHDRRTVVSLRHFDQRADRSGDPTVAAGCAETRRLDLDGHWFTDRITRGVEHAGGEVIGVEIHTKHPAAAKLVELGYGR